MSKALTIIEREHRNLGALLFCLESLVEDIEKRGAVPDFGIFRTIFEYIGSFLDRYHHPKEDAYLFRRLRARHPDAGSAIDAIEAEHVRGPSLLAGMRATLEAYALHPAPGTFEVFRDAVRDYVEFERAHAHREEAEIFPLARKHLTDEDWEAIANAFTAHEDPLFGDEPAREFRDLFSVIVGRVPAPHGLAPSWPRQA